ncbi:hypothetical protein AB5N19_10524 [Seiridium cardinale]
MARNWREKKPGVWAKELGGLEKTYRFLSRVFERTGHEHWGLYSICTASFTPGSDPVKSLRLAWKALRLEFPGLGVVVKGYKAEYHTTTPESLETWAAETLVEEPTRTADEIIRKYPIQDLPTLHYFPATSEVLFLTSHWRVDAVGSCLLLNRLFDLVAEQPNLSDLHWNQEIVRLSPSLEDAVGSPEATDATIESTTRRVTSDVQRRARESIGLAYRGDLSTPAGDAASEAVRFTREASANLLEACKQRQISVSAAVYVALGWTMFALGKGGDSADEFTTIMAVNMRPYLQPPFRTSDHACQAYVSSITPAVQKNVCFEESAESVTKYFKNWHTEDYNRAVRQIYHQASEALLNPAPRPPPPNPPSGVTLSSLGAVDNFLTVQHANGVRVENFRFGVSILSRQVLLYVWTFDGHMHLSLNYNAAYYEASTAREVLERMRASLEEGLGTALPIAERV